MAFLSREKLGYLPGSMDAVYLVQDIEALDAALKAAAGAPRESMLGDCAELEVEARRLKRRELITKVLLQRADILLALGDHQAALAALTEAETVLGDFRAHDLRAGIDARKVEAWSRLEDWPAVLAACAEAIPRVEKHRYQVSGQYLQSGYLRSRIRIYSRGIQAAYHRGDQETALSWAELSKCRSILRRRDQASPPDGSADQTSAQFHRVCEQIDQIRARGRPEDAEELGRLRWRRRTLWDLMLIQRAEGDRRPLPEFSTAAVRASLAADEVVIYYYWLDKHQLLITALHRDGTESRLQAVSAEQRRELEDYAKFVMGFHEGNADREFDTVMAFSPLLLPKWLEVAMSGKKRLLISPHRLLHAIPFHALPWPPEGDFLIQHYTVTYVPNLTALLLPYAPPVPARVLALGIAEYRVPGHPLRPLPEAEEELRQLRAAYLEREIPVDAWLGPEATELRMDELARSKGLQAYTCLHLACHGMNVNTETPMESHLFLADSILDGMDIADWSLNPAALVVLSACSSGQRAIENRQRTSSAGPEADSPLGEELPGDDLFGLQAAFFAAGAKQVLGSLWPVTSSIAQQLMVDFHGRLAGGAPAESALQAAICRYLASVPSGRFRRVFYWAPFFLSVIGRPGPPDPPRPGVEGGTRH